MNHKVIGIDISKLTFDKPIKITENGSTTPFLMTVRDLNHSIPLSKKETVVQWKLQDRTIYD